MEVIDEDMAAASRRRAAWPRWVVAWFALDGLVSLAPPLYWWADGKTVPVLGLPAALTYFLAVGACTSASVVAAYVAQNARGTA